VFKLGLGDFRFPFGTNIVDYLWVYTWGKVRPRLKAKELEIAAVGAPMSAVPQVSEFWYADGANGSKILTWNNFFLGRVPISELDGSESDFSRVERVDRVEGDELDFNTETQRHREKSSLFFFIFPLDATRSWWYITMSKRLYLGKVVSRKGSVPLVGWRWN
jgi:hypothetical protein